MNEETKHNFALAADSILYVLFQEEDNN